MSSITTLVTSASTLWAAIVVLAVSVVGFKIGRRLFSGGVK